MHHIPSLPTSNENTESQAEREHKITQLRLLFGHSSSLMSNDSFRFFLSEIVNPIYEGLTATALDVNETSEKRDEAVKIRKVVEDILCWAKSTRDSTEQALREEAAREKAETR